MTVNLNVHAIDGPRLTASQGVRGGDPARPWVTVNLRQPGGSSCLSLFLRPDDVLALAADLMQIGIRAGAMVNAPAAEEVK